MTAPLVNLSFPHAWDAEILPRRPAILPARRFVYPQDAEEVERGALEVMIQPRAVSCEGVPGAAPLASTQGFLATCAVGFLDPVAPSGIWAAPNPAEICAVSGGYAYLIDTAAPPRFTMIPFRPVLEIRALVEHGLLLFVGHHAIIAWGRAGQAWQSEKLSDEGVTLTGVEAGILNGMGWNRIADRETPFRVDLGSGGRIPDHSRP